MSRRATWLVVLTLGAGAIAPAAADAQQRGLSSDWQRGANVTAWDRDGYLKPSAETETAALASTGTTHSAVVSTLYMNNRNSSTVVQHPTKTPSDASVLNAIRLAKARGMTVMVKPHVDVLDNTFRGHITPASVDAWFDSYRALVNRYAELAAQGGAEMLCIGTELSSMSVHEGQWRRIIAEVRQRFGGKLTFGGNWTDGAKAVGFWDELDYIGIDAYMPLSDGDVNPSVDELAAAWHHRGLVREIEALHKAHKRPVIFTELGYQSRSGTSSSPWWLDSAPVALEPQQRAYEAAFRVWSQYRWFKGIYWWDWSLDGYNKNSQDGSHRYARKPAEQVVRDWHSAAAVEPPAPVEPTPPPPPAAPEPTPAAPAPVTADAAPRPLRVDLLQSGRRKLSLRLPRYAGPEARRCGGQVVIRLSRWSRSRDRWGGHRQIRKATPEGARRVSVRLPRLRGSRYRVRARTTRACPAKSRVALFRR